MKKTKILLLGLMLCMAQPMCSQNLGSVLKAIHEAKKKSKKGRETVSPTDVNAKVTNQEKQVTKADDDIILVVSAVGTTTEEATKTALRSAIEQAYGTFVSANTTILNDELVKDEIVTVANGNIKNYKEIANTTLADGRISVTLQAMVSISKLVSYAQSKGASTEFAGAAFAMNMKMKELNKKNEMAALENLLVQVKAMVPYAFDRELVINTPKQAENRDVNSILKIMAFNYVNKIPDDFYNAKIPNYNDFYADQRLEDKIQIFFKEKGKLVQDVENLLNNSTDYYEMSMEVRYKKNENTDAFFNLIFNTLKSLALTYEEQSEMMKQNIKFSKMMKFSIYYQEISKSGSFYFRNSEKYLDEWAIKLRAIIFDELSNFVITDNLGGKTSLKNGDMIRYNHEGNLVKVYRRDNLVLDGLGLFYPLAFVESSGLGGLCYVKYYDGGNYVEEKISDATLFSIYNEFCVKLLFYIPKDKIMEYTNFTIERRTSK